MKRYVQIWDHTGSTMFLFTCHLCLWRGCFCSSRFHSLWTSLPGAGTRCSKLQPITQPCPLHPACTQEKKMCFFFFLQTHEEWYLRTDSIESIWSYWISSQNLIVAKSKTWAWRYPAVCRLAPLSFAVTSLKLPFMPAACPMIELQSASAGF